MCAAKSLIYNVIAAKKEKKRNVWNLSLIDQLKNYQYPSWSLKDFSKNIIKLLNSNSNIIKRFKSVKNPKLLIKNSPKNAQKSSRPDDFF